MTNRILVIGGAGFVGSALIAELQRCNYEVFVIDNLSSGNREFITIPESRFFKVDILNQSELDQAFLTIAPNWIIHLAAVHFIPYCNQRPFESSHLNIKGTINVLQSAKKLKHLERIFFASTAAVYPICNGAISEEQQPGPLDIYGLTKLTGEQLVRGFHLETSVPTIICRFFNIFGPNETNPHVIPEIQRQVKVGLRTIQLGNLEPKRDFIHTVDMARAVMLLLKKFDAGVDIFNLGSGKEYSVVDLVKAFERQLGEPITIEVEPSRVRKVERMHLLADVSKLTSSIDWTPQISLDEGIKTLIKVEPALVS